MTALPEVSCVCGTFDGYRSINKLSFSIGMAEMRAIIGRNGAGKTKPDHGAVTFGERRLSLSGMDEARIARQGIGRSPWRVLFRKPEPADMARVHDLAAEVGLAGHPQRKSGELSHGQKQWLEMAMLPVREPRLLMVDEPAAGMTPAEREPTTALLVSLARTRAMVLVEHDMDFVPRLNCRVTVLHGSDFAARAGEIPCIIGPNGVGKTSFLRALAGTHPRSGGNVALNGKTLPVARPQDMARRGLSVAPQGRMIVPLLTVRGTLETAFAVLPKSRHRIPAETFDLFPILKSFPNRRGDDLSGGQQQLAIARAFIMRPRVLLLVEPTGAIQPSVIRQIGLVPEYLKGKGDMAIVPVEQSFEFAHGLTDQIHALQRGAVSLSGRVGDLDKETLRATVSV